MAEALGAAGRRTHRKLEFGDVGRAKVRIGALEAPLAMMADQLAVAPIAAATAPT
jgi:hypothetical protein